tara:strand:- start:28 stop:1152 length:1125 start_codon:yes stop_codon:yes gene_type:complete
MLTYNFSKKSFAFFLLFISLSANTQITYNWQNSKEGWVSGGGCTLTEQPDAMAMRSFNTTPVMRSGNLQADLGIDASDYNKVEITLKNPTTTPANANARLFVYPPGSNTAFCYFNFLVDTSMTGYATYTIHLDSTPTNGIYSGPVARFGLRGPWGVANGDTIYWKQMVVSNTNIVVDTVDITFKLNMANVTDPFTTPELNGTFNSWCGNCNPMSPSTQNDIWEVTLPFVSGDTIEYKFSADDWSIQETNDPTGDCTNGNANFTNRLLIIPDVDTILIPVCWGSCDTCTSVSSNFQHKIENVLIYPNPTDGLITIQSNDMIDKIIIRDIFGKTVLTDEKAQKSILINSSNFQSNVYCLSYLINNKWETEYIVIQH